MYDTKTEEPAVKQCDRFVTPSLPDNGSSPRPSRPNSLDASMRNPDFDHRSYFGSAVRMVGKKKEDNNPDRSRCPSDWIGRSSDMASACHSELSSACIGRTNWREAHRTLAECRGGRPHYHEITLTGRAFFDAVADEVQSCCSENALRVLMFLSVDSVEQ